MAKIVKYHNDLNSVSFRSWNAEEMNLFFTIIAKIRDKGTETISLDASELKELSQFADRHFKRWKDVMTGVGTKVMDLKYYEISGGDYSIMNLFQEFTVKPTEQAIVVSATGRFEYIINQIQANFTTYELEEFVNLNSTYSKTAYRLLKQWRTVGKKEFKFDDFKRLMDMPKYYTPSHIDKNVIAPIKRELPEYFEDLKIKKVKANTRGTPVIAYIFTWKPEVAGVWIEDKYKKRVKRKETLPNWVTDPVKNDDKLSEEAQREVKENLERFKQLKEQ